MKTTGHLFVVFDALNLVKGIKTIGGSENQTYYIESKKFVPDRRITPLIWQPYIYVTDPNGIIPSGDKVGELSSSAWYIGSIEPSNRVTDKEDTATIDTPFAVDSNNALHVRKNTDKPIQVFFEAEYLDTRKDKVVHISLSMVISGTSNSEDKPAPKLSLSKPQSWKYSPFENTNNDVVEAKLSQDGQLLSGAVEWCKVEGDVESPLSEEDAFYLGGQNTDKLSINPSLMPSTLLRARNLSEEVYNRFYGINPEWDNRMQEVMENRNLYCLNNSDIIRYYMRSDGLKKAPDNSACIYYKINKAGKYTASIKSSVPIFRIGYSEEDILTGADSYSLKDVNMADNVTSKTIDVTDKAKYIVVQFSSTIISEILQGFKLEQSETTTPYTPAPSDLNYRNLVVNSSNYKGTKGWRLLGNSLNLRIEDDYLAYDAKLNDVGWKGIGTEQILSINKGDKYYSAFEVLSSIKLTSENSPILDVTLLDTKAASGGGLYYSYQFEVVEVNKIQTISGLLVGNKNANDAYLRIRHSLNTDKTFTLKLNNIRLINLTEKFGAGNEPTKEQCDEIFAEYGYIPAPEDLTPDGIIKGSYQSDIKFTRYLPKLDTSIEFLTGDTLRAGMTSVKMKAVVKTNKELISNPSKYFDIKWYLEPTSAGAKEEFLGSGEVIEVPVSKIDVKGGRFIPFRFDLKEKLL